MTTSPVEPVPQAPVPQVPVAQDLVPQAPVVQDPVVQDAVPQDPASAAEPAVEQGSHVRRLLREWGPLVVGTLLVAFVLRSFVVQSYEIPSESMLPTLVDGNRVIVNRLSYQLGEVERGQVVVFDRPPLLAGENDLIKRIIGLPGETVRFVDNKVYVNGLRVVEPYLLEPDSTSSDGPIPGCAQAIADPNQCLVPEGYVFVLGDNRNGSSDSREFGPVPIDTIVGRAFWTVWPPTDLSQL